MEKLDRTGGKKFLDCFPHNLPQEVENGKKVGRFPCREEAHGQFFEV